MAEKSNEVVSGELLDFIQEESAADVSAGSEFGWDHPIFRVPIDFLGGHENYYIPKTVSIGPFHARDISLSSADEQKRADLKRFLSSFAQGTTVEQLMQELTKLEEKSVGDSTDQQQLKAFFKRFVSRFSRGTTVEQLVQEMMKSGAMADLGHKDESTMSYADEVKKNSFRKFIHRLSRDKSVKEDIIPFLVGREQDARDYYAGKNFLSSFEFLKMMLLDGCFIVEWLLEGQDFQEIDEEEQFVTSRSGRFPALYNFQQDMLKLENQIPFFILSHLYNLVDTKRKKQTLVGSAISFFQISMPKEHRLISNPNIRDKEIYHLLHLVKMALFDSSSTVVNMTTPNSSSTTLAKKMGASELESSYGIVFAKRENVSLPDITFKNGVLSIPQLVFEESSTPPLFFNLLASELYSEEFFEGVFTSYVIFMDGLISNEKDVEVLLRSEIFKTQRKDVKGLVNFFNELAMNAFTTKENFHFEGILEKVNKYCKSGLRPVRSYLVNNYYESRWEVLSSFLLLFLTVTQTLFSILSYSPQNMRK